MVPTAQNSRRGSAMAWVAERWDCLHAFGSVRREIEDIKSHGLQQDALRLAKNQSRNQIPHYKPVG